MCFNDCNRLTLVNRKKRLFELFLMTFHIKHKRFVFKSKLKMIKHFGFRVGEQKVNL